MSQLKLATALMVPILLSSAAFAQELRTDCSVRTPPTPLKDEVYGSYTPYTGPLLGVIPQQCSVAAVPPKAPDVQTASSIAPQQTPLLLKAEAQTNEGHGPSAADVAPAPATASIRCQPPTPRKDEVYGSFVPYTGPLLGMVPKCEVATVPSTGDTPIVPTLFDNASSLNLSSTPERQPVSSQPASAINNDLAIAPTPSIGEPASMSEYVRSVPLQRAPTIPVEIRPFRTLAVGFKADTLGLGIEFATPMAFKINLRSSVNFFAFNDPFSIDGVNYDARLHLKSSETTVDWFPHGEGGFHISPGFLYIKNTMSAPASVGPGQTFVLGTQTFINSVDDPMTGSSSVVYPHNFVPMLLLGYGNIIPRARRRISFPVEFGAAYSGAPVIAVALTGTACTTNGCVNFATNTQAQTFLKQEVHNLNEDLKRYPVFPIVSFGVAYHF